MTVTASSVATVAARCLRSPGAVDPDMPLALLGLDSLSSIEMAAELESAFGCELPTDLLLDCADARSLAARISELRAVRARDDRDDPFESMLADAVLPPDVTPPAGVPRSADLQTAHRILLTGASGFLGGALLDELLDTTRAEIVCLVRNAAQLPHHTARVRLLVGDLAHPRLGLGHTAFDQLAGEVDRVLHCGAAVNWVYTYAGLRAANVTGTLELLRLACQQGVPFHFVSSLSVCYPTDGPRSADEDYDALPHVRGVHLGYAQSKVVAEALVREAGERGLPVRIYRPSLISGDSTTGAFNRNDLITALVHGCVQMGTAPDLDWNLDCQPVNVVARAIVRLSGGQDRVLHLGHARPRHWRECVLWMRMYGYDIRLVPYHFWLRQLDAETAPSVSHGAAHPLRALRTFFLNRHAAAHGMTLPELYEERRRTHASSHRTLAALADGGLDAPALDAALLERYFAAFRSTGAIPPPTRATACRAEALAKAGPTLVTDARQMSALFDREIVSVTVIGSGSEHSIVSELTAWRSRRQTGLTAACVQGADGSELKIRLKAKAEDADVIAVGEALAGLVDPAIGAAYAQWRDRIGFTASHLREIEIYRQTDPRFTRHAPALLGARGDQATGTWLLALEDLSAARLLNTADTPEAWTSSDIEVTLRGLASLQSIWYDREAALRQMPWIGYVQCAAGMAEMAELWTVLAAHAAPAFSSWADPDIAAVQRRMIASIPRWWPALEALPRTLIHHDFNPRNVCLRNGTLCAYDWELATIGAPQRDLVEFLCFVLTPGASPTEIQRWVNFHRLALEQETGRRIDAEAWQRGAGAALYDLMLNRLATYALVHRIRPQAFLPRVVRTWWRLYEHFRLEEHE